MFFTIVISVIYIFFVAYLAIDINRIKNHLVEKGAFSPETAQFTESDALAELLFLNNQFSFLAIKMEADGRLWINMQQWRSNVIIYFIAVVITLLTFIGIFVSYL